jgi:hypothetical protein
MKISYIIRRLHGKQVITEPDFKWSYPTQEDAIEAIEAFCEKHDRTGNEFLIWTLATYEKPKAEAIKDSNPLIHDPLIRWEWVSQTSATREASSDAMDAMRQHVSELSPPKEIPAEDDLLIVDASTPNLRRNMPIRKMKLFSHRNGETEPPTEEGEYWFRGEVGGESYAGRVPVSVWVSFKQKLMAQNPFSYVDVDMYNFVGQWWGPIVPPWEDR